MSISRYSGSCKCNSIKYTLPNEPEEIANCHCTICQRLHDKPFVSFAKYNINEVLFTGKKYFKYIRSSERASRGYCSICNTFLFMRYKKSENIWMNTDTFNFDVSSIEHYNIYTDTAVVDICINDDELY